jgi:2-keto-4-pentenoate hydratase/2-oxohepta-3-ene-1,7-dioic acid hydratase in catechol pathway
MKLVTFLYEGRTQPGLLDADQVLPLNQAGFDDALSLIADGQQSLDRVGALVVDNSAFRLELGSVKLLAPLTNPPRIFGIGLNYRDHAIESKMAVQNVPTVFLKLPSSIIGPDADVPLPPEAAQPDYEAELAVVIGKAGHRILPSDWKKHVFGYTIINDVSARGVQLATSQWSLGKSFPGFTPMGPAIVTTDEISDPHELSIQLTLNGELMQSANTRDLIFKIPELIAYISALVPLQPGDIISTGTPSGVGMGRTPQLWLKPGDKMIIKIEHVGILRNCTSTGS